MFKVLLFFCFLCVIYVMALPAPEAAPIAHYGGGWGGHGGGGWGHGGGGWGHGGGGWGHGGGGWGHGGGGWGHGHHHHG